MNEPLSDELVEALDSYIGANLVSLEVGKTYMNRKGKYVVITEIDPSSPTLFRGRHIHTNVYSWYYADGRHQAGMDSPLDLVSITNRREEKR